MNDSKEKTHPNLQVPLARPWFDDAEPKAAMDVVRSGWVIFGPKVEEFEKRFAAKTGAKHAIAVNSGSSALLVAMAALGVGEGDEIISPDMTFVSTATSAMFLGARPRFCEIENRYYGMDAADLERHITKKTKAIVPVHFAGQSCEMAAILEVAKKHGIPVLEDAAESHTSQYGGKHTGTLGEIGIFSFTPSKVMTTGEGGMIITNDDALNKKCRLYRNFGDSGKFEWNELGFNFRMPEVMGAIGLCQLDKLDESVRRRRAIAEKYRAALATSATSELITLPKERKPEDHNYQLFTILLDTSRLSVSRDEIIQEVWQRGISLRAYYPALHRAGVFKRFGVQTDAEYPNTVFYADRCMSLPIYPTLTAKEQDTVVEVLLDVLAKRKK